VAAEFIEALAKGAQAGKPVEFASLPSRRHRLWPTHMLRGFGFQHADTASGGFQAQQKRSVKIKS
jgi:hypothetical protein